MRLREARRDEAGCSEGRFEGVPLRWPYLVFDKGSLVGAGEMAYHRAVDGTLWEYIDGTFRFGGPDDACRRLSTFAEAPAGPWRHLPGCVCEACRLGDV